MTKKKLLGILLCFVLAFNSQLAACSACSPEPIIETESSEKETEEIVLERTPEPRPFNWDPYKFNLYWQEAYGELARDDYHNVVDAIVNQEESCYCTAQFEENLEEILRVSFPPALGLFTYMRGEDGDIHFTFSKTKEEQDVIWEKYDEEMTKIAKGYTYDGDTSAMIAVELFARYGKGDLYTFAHLLIQCDIPAAVVTVGKEKCVLFQIDGESYYANTEKEDGEDSLKYFAYIPEGAEEVGTRFDEARSIVAALTLDRKGKELYVVGYDDKMNQISVKVE